MQRSQGGHHSRTNVDTHTFCGSSKIEWKTSVADRARKTSARDSFGNTAKDPRERYPSSGTCDDEELPADVELLGVTKQGSLASPMMAATFSDTIFKIARSVRTSESRCRFAQEGKLEHVSKLLKLPKSDCIPRSTRPKSLESVGDPAVTKEFNLYGRSLAGCCGNEHSNNICWKMIGQKFMHGNVFILIANRGCVF